MTNDTTNKYKGIKILCSRDDDFSEWEFDIENHLCTKNQIAWMTVCMEHRPPEVDQEDWNKANFYALSEIGKCIGGSIKKQCIGIHDPNVLFDKITSIFHRKKPQERSLALRKFLTTTSKEYKSIAAYVDGMRELMVKCGEVGWNLETQFYSIVLCDNLIGDEYYMFREAMASAAECPDFDEIASSLLLEGKRKEQESIEDTGLITKNEKTQKSIRNNKLRCYGCGEIGHPQFLCDATVPPFVHNP